MTDSNCAVAERESEAADVLSFEAADVTGTNQLFVEDVDRSLPAGAVARALAARMSLPQNVPWGLRENSSSAFLADEQPIGNQIGPWASVTLTPKSHLG
jgi:hypothetical protein